MPAITSNNPKKPFNRHCWFFSWPEAKIWPWLVRESNTRDCGQAALGTPGNVPKKPIQKESAIKARQFFLAGCFWLKGAESA
jgi:hypothetical protein